MGNHTCNLRRDGSNRNRGAYPDDTERSQHNGKQDHKYHPVWFLRDERGTIIDFLITSMLIFFFLFAGTDYFTTICQYQIAEHIMHYYLERARVEGYLPTQDQSNMITQYASAQMNVINISCTNPENPGVQLTAPLQRNTDDPNASEIDLIITIKPYYQPFTTGSADRGECGSEFVQDQGRGERFE